MSAGGEGIALDRALRAWLEDQVAWGIEDVLAPAAERPEGGEAAAAAATVAERARREELLAGIAREAAACERCPLHAGRRQAVPGQGSPESEVMFVGEAPGAEEDRRGLAFVGLAGQLLSRMIRAMGFEREEVFIANVLKCRPPENRDPRPEEAASCLPFLKRQIDVVRPRVLIALGAHAARNLLDAGGSVGRLRGRVHRCHETPLIVTYHPSYLLRAPHEKAKAWEDLKLALRTIGREPPSLTPAESKP